LRTITFHLAQAGFEVCSEEIIFRSKWCAGFAFMLQVWIFAKKFRREAPKLLSGRSRDSPKKACDAQRRE
jgi:hypothetical protein